MYLTTKCVSEGGSILLKTNDGRNDMIVILDSKIKLLIKGVIKYQNEGIINDPETSTRLNTLGYPLSELPEKRSLTYPGDANYNLGYESGYIRGYEGEGICESIAREILNIFASAGGESDGVNLVIRKPNRNSGWKKRL